METSFFFLLIPSSKELRGAFLRKDGFSKDACVCSAWTVPWGTYGKEAVLAFTAKYDNMSVCLGGI